MNIAHDASGFLKPYRPSNLPLERDPRRTLGGGGSLSCSPTMPWFDPVFHPPRPEARIGHKGKMTAGPPLEEGHSEGECRQDAELCEGCPRHDRQRHRVYRPIPEPGNQND